MITKFKSISRFFEGLFFPLECISCGDHCTENIRLCSFCLNHLKPFTIQECFFEVTHIREHLECISLYPLTHPIRQLFVGLKYHEHPYEFLKLLEMRLLEINHEQQFQDFLPKNAILIPVPLHPTKLRERGYNQAFKIAEVLAKVGLGNVNTSLVKRIHPNQKQAGLSRLLRYKNSANIFALSKMTEFPEDIPIILIDDVITTGATLLSLQREIQKKYPKNPCRAFGVVKAILPRDARDFALEQQL